MNGRRSALRVVLARVLVAGWTAIAIGAAGSGSVGAEPPPGEATDPAPPQIIGGEEVDPVGRYPFVVALVTSSGFQFCGGSLIAPTWVLTAAHCLTDGSGTPDISAANVDVLVGRHDLGTSAGTRIDVATIVIHPGWLVPPNAANSDDDIALLELTVGAPGAVRIAGPGDAPLRAAGLPGTVLGWGSTVADAPYNSSQVLRSVDVPFVDDVECAAVWGGVVNSRDVCAGPGPDGEDSCVGDSGGPLVAPVGDGPWTLIGVVSFGDASCGAPGIPAVYSRVAAYADWIGSIAVIDTEGPTVVVEQGDGQADPATAAPVRFTATFSEPVVGFDDADVVVGGTAGATTAVVTPIGAGSTVFDVAVSSMTSGGTVVVTVPPGVATDAIGNPNEASTSVDNEVRFEPRAPLVTVEQAAGQDDPTGAAPIRFTVRFSTAVAGFVATDVLLGGSAGATTVEITSASFDGRTYDLAVDGMAGSGIVTATVPAGVAVDGDGNPNQASSSVDNAVTFDVTAPLIETPGRIETTAAPGRDGVVVDFTVTATDGGVVTALPGAATASATASLVPPGGVVCAPPSGSFFRIGTTVVECTATDLVGNASRASFAVVVVDTEPPVITDPGPQAASIAAPPFGVLEYVPATATDNSGAVGVVCDPAVGSLVGVGTTRVTCTATDPSGNTIGVAFDVVITAPRLPATGRDGGLLGIAVPLVLAGSGLVALSRVGARRRRVLR